jgi:hypothetical protein
MQMAIIIGVLLSTIFPVSRPISELIILKEVLLAPSPKHSSRGYFYRDNPVGTNRKTPTRGTENCRTT